MLTSRALSSLLLLTGPALLAVGCASPPTDEAPVVEQISSAPAGALVSLAMSSTVGVLLDDIPAGPAREAAAANALAQPSAFWTDRATRQTKLTFYRLVFRSGYYAAAHSSDPHFHGPLPLPPNDVWHVALSGQPRRVNDNGHDMIEVGYTFNSYLVTDAGSPGAVEASLGTVGGTWDEPFELPVDPELILQRTGYACMDEYEYPPHSVFEENTFYFYDDSCHVGSACHVTEFPQESCVESLSKHSGIVKPSMHFARVAYDANLAAQYRSGPLWNPNGADLAVVQEAISDERAIFYRYFDPTDCSVVEGDVPAPGGWRRLLAFSAVVRNDGTQPVHIGNPRDPSNPWVKANVFTFSQCHNHYHFTHYGTFFYGDSPGSKRAFCMEDTNRFHNDEITPLTAEHQTCEMQGIGHGWGDEYNFGIPGQWVDVTSYDTSTAHDLRFVSNPDQFLCEGWPLDGNNNEVDPHNLTTIAFDPTGFLNANNQPVFRMRCERPANWFGDNVGSVPFSSPSGSFVTDGCTRGQEGPLRDCGFTAQPQLHTCTPGQKVTLTCGATGSQVLRICERSEKLGVGISCAYRDAIANVVVDGQGKSVSFTCPAVRDAAHAGTGGYAVLQATTTASATGAAIACTGW
jgi:hypothetical protein